MAHRLEVFRADEIVLELLRRRLISWQDVLVAGDVDPLEAEHREFVELQVTDEVVVILSEPL